MCSFQNIHQPKHGTVCTRHSDISDCIHCGCWCAITGKYLAQQQLVLVMIQEITSNSRK